ncbi:transcriptional repressor [Thalassobaculum fulvum]|uniref:Transcriptional repressor n=1 Tax=Thalassobaculum fulvum TaxID=1633335 RepID=A0A918XS74_9PROT|nr:Fur family transcriptional regulator [Thalassobaculum fulvum]GHD51737.1 transcriptional repressor [Thalassobaculum fulvum]
MAEAERFPGHEHDHAHCVADALAAAEIVCRQRGARLTDLRRRVLELIWESHAPIGAYELIDKLSRAREADGEGGRVAPPTVYRALEFLIEQGLVHRIESRNAFVGCAQPEHPHRGYFLICETCGIAHELEGGALDADLKAKAREMDFEIRRITIEVAGRCPACRRPGGQARSRPSHAGEHA